MPSHPHSHVPLLSAVRGCAAAGIPRFELASDSQVRRSWRLSTALTTAGPRHMLLVSSRSACLSLVYQISLSLCVQGASAGAPSRSIAGADTAHLAGNSTPPQAQALLHTFHARVLSIPIVVRAGLVLILQWDDWAAVDCPPSLNTRPRPTRAPCARAQDLCLRRLTRSSRWQSGQTALPCGCFWWVLAYLVEGTCKTRAETPADGAMAANLGSDTHAPNASASRTAAPTY